MAFWRPHPRQRRTCEEYKAELKEENYHLQIQDLGKEIERLENASEEEISELKSEIFSLKNQLYQAKKDVRDKEKYISSLEKWLVESEEQVEKLRCQIKIISSRKNSSERGNSLDLYNPNINLEMATITELANAIDGYVENRTTARDILIDQIKRMIRQAKEKNSRQIILALQNNPLNMAEGRRLPVLKLIAPALAKFQPYIGQEPPDDYLDKVIQSWAYLESHMTVLENANAGDFDNAIKCNILKSMMGGKYAPVPANNSLVAGNLAINTPDTLRA
ncbi:hypothetical protein RclHR1_15220014 [Rhizophagus clarus]|uniref:Uncharacterized protein n=1 Tax=Rhizophagus clarus TaxID=94130 RepID=A0A2Z6QEP6_9GLOM|nr:hypothetical protein RclHR1_15220014 [Rhizophagus clarus]